MPTVFAGLMCHAPIVVPAVGGPESARCAHTTRAMREVAARAVASLPDRLVLISPHSPRRRGTFSAWSGRHRGDLGDFRAPQVAIDLPDAPEVAQHLNLSLVAAGSLDHGAIVPLAFLGDAGWSGPTAILSLAIDGGNLVELGRAIAALPGRTAVIASGDMSHRLVPGAPSGYHPDAAAFDRAFVDALRHDRWQQAIEVPNREIAAEDVVDTTLIAMAAAGDPSYAEVLSYEGPWGVGYTEAILYDPHPPLYAVARATIRAHVTEVPYRPPSDARPAAGVFVTLHRHGALRGCIGTITATQATLLDEVTAMAIEAATADPRFPPVTVDELDDLDVDVSVLQPPEPIDTIDALDPKQYGVIVTHGGRRGLLLPDIDGIDTALQQVAIARRKAGIAPGTDVALQRFRVVKDAPP